MLQHNSPASVIDTIVATSGGRVMLKHNLQRLHPVSVEFKASDNVVQCGRTLNGFERQTLFYQTTE